MTGGCPKSMTFGPCGGVRNDGGCEVDGHRCPFLDGGIIQPVAARPVVVRLPATPIVVDVRGPNLWRGDERALWRRTAEVLDGCAALLGEHVDNPVLRDDAGALPHEEVIGILAATGVTVIATVTGRDRDLDAARRTMCRFRDAGASAIHCVTGDHPAALGIDRSVHFGTESMDLIGIAVAEGIGATVAESPLSPGPRPERLRTKEIAGASMCIVNHGGDHSELTAFADRVRQAGATLPLLAPVPMIGDARAALGLATFPGLRLPHGYLDAIVDAIDPAETGRRAAATLTAQLAATGRFVGVNLSGSASGSDPWQRLESTEAFIDCTRAAWSEGVRHGALRDENCG
ncbi:MAG: putative 5,10-methylenetetrahydrofolate reductase [Acidimicrobiales bacterium]|nr:putative 5,10-methylenetetrahydrofolate reductase [Acidimicrobiales bacterium]